VCTSNGSPYTNFQNRIMYATYKLAQQEPGGEVLAGFTRILHRTAPDELMQVHRTHPCSIRIPDRTVLCWDVWLPI
jgi:hydroxyproline O-arabinosyltransferase